MSNQEEFVTDSIQNTNRKDSPSQIVSDSFTSQRATKQSEIYYDNIPCIRNDTKKNHTAPIQSRTREFTDQEAQSVAVSFAITGDKTKFEELPQELKLSSVFTVDKEKNTTLNISLITGQQNASFAILNLVNNLSKDRKEAYLNYQNFWGRNSAHLATISGDGYTLNALLNTKAININATDMKLRTVFHYLPETKIQMPTELIENPFARYALNYHDSEGQTPVHIALERGNYHILKAYISMGADLTVTDKKAQYTPLQYAAQNGNVYNMDMILSTHRFGDINYESPDGLTALCLAVSNDNIKAAEYLLYYGADPMMLRFGNSVLSYLTSLDGDMAKLLYASIKDKDKWDFLMSRIDFSEYDYETEYAY